MFYFTPDWEQTEVTWQIFFNMSWQCPNTPPKTQLWWEIKCDLAIFGVDSVWGIVAAYLLSVKDYMNKREGGASADIENVSEHCKALAALLFLLECEGLLFFLRKINWLGQVSSWYWTDMEGGGIVCIVQIYCTNSRKPSLQSKWEEKPLKETVMGWILSFPDAKIHVLEP